MLAIGRVDSRRNSERAGAGTTRHLGEIGAAQAAARREQGQGFEEVGLADAVLPDQRHEPAGHGKVKHRVGTKVLENKARDARSAISLSLDGRGVG
jgi:hypothetical protein